MEAQKSTLNLNGIELHYWLNDQTHTMNAVVLNNCTTEFLAIAYEIATKLKLDIEIETEPIGNGGIRSFFTIKSKDKYNIKKEVLIALLIIFFGAPLDTALRETMRKVIDKIFEDKEFVALQKEKDKAALEYDIARLKLETQRLCDSINENKVTKRRSNYYFTAQNYTKIEAISVSSLNNQQQIVDEVKVPRSDFKHFIIPADEISVDIDEWATIEIIAPVLKQSDYDKKYNYKWCGLYNGTVIRFSIKSEEFKERVQAGDVIFKNGTTLNCQLLQKKKITRDGTEKTASYEVLLVHGYYDNESSQINLD